MNNKGQSLVTFILFLPVLFILIAVIYDLGSLEINKTKNINEIKSAITYGLKNIDDSDIEQKLNTILDKNLKGTKTLYIENNTIKVNIKYKEKSIFPSIIKKNYLIDITYKGYIDNGKITITKE